MSKVVEVILADSEFQGIKKLARSQNVSIAEWVRVTLNLALRRESAIEIRRKLAVVHAAARYDYPTGDMVRVLRDIEKGYGS
ncbi:MAG: hypothetical protein WAL95_06895 [Candidatus Acidiferrales bacterium]